MAIKINVGINQKIGQPNYGSLGANCNVEFELDGSFETGATDRFHEATRRAYVACRKAVQAELSTAGTANRRQRPNGNGPHRIETGTYEQHGHNQRAPADGPGPRKATSSQIRAIHAIANRNRVDLSMLLSQQFRVAAPQDLSIADASQLIDQLKADAADNGIRR